MREFLSHLPKCLRKRSLSGLKKIFMQPLVLALLDFSLHFTIECDASGIAIGSPNTKGKTLSNFQQSSKR